MNKVQILQFELLKFVDGIARQNNISFWLDGGTLLGAVRNEQFIPWDNDIDICLLLSDYLKLIPLLESACEDHDYYFVYRENKYPHWLNNLADIRILENGLLPVRIDIIPVIGLNNSQNEIDSYLNKLDLAHYYINGKFRYNPDRQKPVNPSESILQFTGKHKFMESFVHDMNVESAPLNEASILSYIFHDCMVKKERAFYRYDDIFPLSKINFEGSLFPAPGNTASYLIKLYGENYLTPPPKNFQQPKSLNYSDNKQSKLRTLAFVDLFQHRDYILYKTRSTNYRAARMLTKVYVFICIAKRAIQNGLSGYIVKQLTYSFFNWRK